MGGPHHKKGKTMTTTTTAPAPATKATAKVAPAKAGKSVELNWDVIAKAYANDYQAVGQAERFTGEAIRERVTYGEALLALDHQHGWRVNGSDKANKEAAIAANAAFAEVMAAKLGDKFPWDRTAKGRASQARNLARGTVALEANGLKVRNDSVALKALGTLASRVGAAEIAKAGKAVAELVAAQGETPDVAKAVRQYLKGIKAEREAASASEGLGALIEALQTALELSQSREEWADDATDDERATLAALLTTWERSASSLKSWANA